MTTIVATREAMYSDKQITGSYKARTAKIVNVNGHLIAGSGKSEQIAKFINWRRDPSQPLPEFREEASFDALELAPDGSLSYWSTELIALPVSEAFAAIGSGCQFAMGALLHGASPEEAIKIASQCDSYTGGGIQVVKLKKARA